MASSSINTLNWSGIILNWWVGPVLFILIFTCGIYIKQSCSLCSLAISVNSLLMYSVGLTTRMLNEGFQVNMFGGNSDLYCKIRTYLIFTFFVISSWFFVCASLDRFDSTNQAALRHQQFVVIIWHLN